MKELSIEEKAKAYDEAIERAKEINIEHSKCGFKPSDNILYIFPELAESEDEKIKKSLIILLQHFCKGYRVPGLDFPVSYKDMLTWLEKQSEQGNNEDEAILHRFSFYSYKDEPNILYLAGLYVNDEYRNKGIGTKILKIADEVAVSMKCSSILLKTEIGSNAERLYKNNGYSVFRREENQVWLEKQGEENHISRDTKPRTYADFYKRLTEPEQEYLQGYIGRVIEKTKELQRQGEQKPYGQREECSDCEFRCGDKCIGSCAMKRGEQKPAEVRTTGYCNVQEVEQKPAADFSDLRTWKYIVDAVLTEKEGIGQYLDSPVTEEVAKKLQKRFGNVEQKPVELEKEEKSRLMKKCVHRAYQQGYDTGFLMATTELEHKQEWNEEDKKKLEECRSIIKQWQDKQDNYYFEGKFDYAAWLKSLKDRCLPQPKQEWSEEDEGFFKAALWHISYSISNGKSTDIYCDTTEWFKSLKDRVQPQNLTVTDEELAKAKKDAYNDALDKIEYHSGKPTFDDGWSAAIWYLKKRNAQPQSHWKPSDEQMYILNWVANILLNHDGVVEEEASKKLQSLYNDLKKLKGL